MSAVWQREQKRIERLTTIHQALRSAIEHCRSGKLAFKKRQDAQSEADRLNKRIPPRGRPIRAKAYRCPMCERWHVGRPND